MPYLTSKLPGSPPGCYLENTPLRFAYFYPFTSESRPSVINIRKNNNDHMVDAGIFVTAYGYTTNARPTPKSTKRMC